MSIHKLKILQVCRLTPIWGMDLFKQISLAFDDNAYEMTTVFLSNQKGYESYDGFNDYNGRIHFFGIKRHTFYWRFVAVWKIRRLLKKEKFDVVIAHHYKPMVLVEMANYFIGIQKLYAINHDVFNLRNRHRRIWVKWFLKKYWKFVAVSEGVKEDLLSANAGLAAGRVPVIHNCVDVKSLQAKQLPREQARKALGIPADCFVFGSIGRLVRKKGFQFLIHAFSKLHESQHPLQVVIIGMGNYEDELIRTAEKYNVQDRVRIETQLAPNAVKYLKAFDVFILPSVKEAFGIVLLEAMSAELPVIATDAGGATEIVSDSGILIPPKDIQALADAMDQVRRMNQKELADMGGKSYKRLTDHFSAEKYRHTFRELVERGGREDKTASIN